MRYGSVQNAEIHLFCSENRNFFGKKTNKSISEYIIDVRIGRASRLLVDTARSISDICYECGFNNISNFNRIFKMRRGVSPSSFRDNYRKNKVII